MSDKPAETIQTLLDAEEKAKVVIEKARTERDARLKQAATEADAQIAQYRASKEAEYQSEVRKYDSSSGSASERIKTDAQRDIATATGAAKANKPKVSLVVSTLTHDWR